MIFSSFLRFFSRKSSSEAVKTFESALEWVGVYIRAHDYLTAEKALTELGTKINEALVYHRDILSSNEPLLTSNIAGVAKEAKLLVASSHAAIVDLEKNLSRIESFRRQIQREKIVFLEKESKKREKTTYIRGKKVVKKYISEKKFLEAVRYAQRLSMEFNGSHTMFGLVEYAQKALAKNKDKMQTSVLINEKVDLLLSQELGIQPNSLIETQLSEQYSFVAKLKATYQGFRKKKTEQSAYVERANNLRTIEDLLRKAGALNLVDGVVDTNSESALEIIQRGTVKDVEGFSLPGFDFEGRIIGKDGVIGDTFGYFHRKDRTIFYFGDATGHGVQAGFTVATLSNLFFDKVRDENLSLIELFIEMNNRLKDLLKGGMFVTAIFFEYIHATKELSYIGGGHEPLYIYRSQTKSVEKLIAGGLALGVRRIVNLESIHKKPLLMEQSDLIFGYTDGVPEARNSDGEMFGLERIAGSLSLVAGKSSKRIDAVLDDVNNFLNGANFLDDVSLYFFERNTKKDVVHDSIVFENILKELDASNIKEAKKLDFKGKTQDEITQLIKDRKHAEEMKIRLSKATELLHLGEYTQLKQVVLECYKDGFIHSKLAFFLREVVKNEENAYQKRQELKMQEKYKTLQDLYKKGEYDYVIRECIDIISRNGNAS